MSAERSYGGVSLERALDGDRDAWNDLIDEFQGLVWAVVRSFRMSPEMQEDAFQATWLKLLDRGRSIDDPRRLPGWLVTVARRECLSQVERSRRLVVASHEIDGMIEPVHLASGIEDEELARAVRAAFWDLDETCRMLLQLMFASPPTPYSVIGDQLGLAVGSLGAKRQRCLAKMRRHREIARIDRARAPSVKETDDHG